ncbi:hypothetical protein [Mesobacillus zeae]|uniref:Uncharacterized protein n=1 Tax=Mesobacillus zeae TaxID=1917180 RepID=A0A398BD46_9BACI|nr:hypothetical protein [Mesobacillus zeae]RID85586.1 hypothetical protein D1970_08485 [Mesobacillus zeae]
MSKVYGLMINSGGADEMLWDQGVWETYEAALEYADTEMGHITGIWVGELKVNDSISEAAVTEDDMVTCSLCGIEYNEADVNTEDYETPICINCEPEYRQSIDMA